MLTEFCQENALVIAKAFFNNTRDDSAHGHHQMANTKIRLIIFFAGKDGEALQSAKTKPGADCGSDHELLIAKFGLNDYTVEVTNRFKGLHLIDRVP